MSHQFQFVNNPSVKSKKPKVIEYTIVEDDEDAQTSSSFNISQ